MNEGDSEYWIWDTDFTLAIILPQIYETVNGPAQMQQCSAKDADNGDDIDWALIHSPVNGILVEGAPNEAAMGVMTSVKRSAIIQIYCIVILDPP